MFIKNTFSIIYILTSFFIPIELLAQTQTVGLFANDSTKTFTGYTLFAPKQNTMTYLINNDGRKIHEWTASKYSPGQTVYLLENGDILRTCMVPGNIGTGGGEGGRIEEYSWNDSLVWYMNYSTATYMQHHDIKRLPNGNIIMLVVEKKAVADVIAAGFDTSKFQEPDFRNNLFFLPDCVIEIQPTFPSGGTVVWQWHVWDHLIQSFDANKSNYGTPGLHPELIDCAGDHKSLPIFWNHMNSIDYDSAFDQIAISVRGNSEVWIIDHSTTITQASSHSGGLRGKGGDLLYRWGNPITYGAGTISNEMYFQQHDVEWVKSGNPGAGDLLCFNNGLGRNYSTIDEITPPVDASGNYSLVSGSAFGPTNLTWTYQATPPTSLYAQDISGAQRLPNGNTLIDQGTNGTFLEVTSAGEVVWKYINPVSHSGPLTQGSYIPDDSTHPGEKLNAVFRIYRYAPAYPAFTGRDLTPGDVIELNPLPVELVSFNNHIIGNSVRLFWETATEINSYAFKIERTTNNSEWQLIQTIRGCGNCSSANYYNYTDTKLCGGTYRYRLKMINNNGSFKYSGIVSAAIETPGEYILMQNYPNPFNPSTSIKYQIPRAGKVQLKVFDIMGREISTLIDEYQQAGIYSIPFNSQKLSLASGIYYCRIITADYSKCMKMILLK